MNKKVKALPVDDNNPKSKSIIAIVDDAKNILYSLKKTRVGGALYGPEKAERLAENLNEEFYPDTEPEEPDTYYIKTTDDFNTMVSKINDGTFEYEKVVIKKNLTFTKGKPVANIVNDKYTKPLNIDGKDHIIRNLTINNPGRIGKGGNGDSLGTYYQIALFGAFNADVTIKDLTFDNAYVGQLADGNPNKGNMVALLFGYIKSNVKLYNVNIQNSTITGFGKVAPYVGILFNGGKLYMENCRAKNNTVRCTMESGGLAGQCYRSGKDFDENITLVNSYAENTTFVNTIDPNRQHSYVDVDIIVESNEYLPDNYHVTGKYMLIDGLEWLYPTTAKQYIATNMNDIPYGENEKLVLEMMVD